MGNLYRPGSWYRLCDITGTKVRAERTKKQWNNYIVREKSWEPRNAQDFVRGRRDDQTVPDPRIRPNPLYIGDITTLASTASIRATSINLSAPIGLVVGNVVAVMLDNGINFFDKVIGFGGAAFIGFIVANTLIVTSMTSGSLSVGNLLSAPGILAGTTIQSQQSGVTGKEGSYLLNNSQTLVGSFTVLGSNIIFLQNPLPFQASSGNAVINTDFVPVTVQSLVPVGS